MFAGKGGDCGSGGAGKEQDARIGQVEPLSRGQEGRYIKASKWGLMAGSWGGIANLPEASIRLF